MGQGKKLGFEILLDEESIAGEFSYNDPNYDFLGNSIFYACLLYTSPSPRD